MRSAWLRALVSARLFSPLGLLVRAGVIVAVFLVLHACGLREYTTLLTGTSPAGGAVDRTSVVLAMLYIAAHLGTVVVAPAMALAALGWAAWNYRRECKTQNAE